MRYSQIRSIDISNGVGVACSIFFQGCGHRCFNCFNKETWDFSGGYEFTKDMQNEFVELCKKPYIDCVSILGGEPLQQHRAEFSDFLDSLQSINKPIYLWSGYTYEEIMNSDNSYVLEKIDYLIDGKYVEELKDYTLKLRGSSNQRIIDCKRSVDMFLKNGSNEPILALDIYEKGVECT